MTYDEVKTLLKELKSARRQAIKLKQDIAEIESDYGALTIHSQLGRLNEIPSFSSTPSSTVERAIERIEAARERFAEALNQVYDYEDMLSSAIKTLSYQEQEIITGYYLKDKTHYQLARERNYDERTIYRIKAKAINKIAKKCK